MAHHVIETGVRGSRQIRSAALCNNNTTVRDSRFSWRFKSGSSGL
jgi:hypothetical protein